MARARVPAASAEVGDADLGDERLNRRLARVVDAAAAAPSAGFPAMTKSDGELEGVYRFLGNARVTPQKILAPHVAATRERAAGGPLVIAHDTTELGFGGLVLREGLGRVGSARVRQGFFAHFAIAVSADESRTVLGVAGLKTFIRRWDFGDRPQEEREADPTATESRRWSELTLATNAAFPGAIHVMDREADSFGIFARLLDANARFVIRLCRDKVVEGSPDLLFRTVEAGQVRVTRSVHLTRRRPHRSATKRKEHPPRSERNARLELRAAAVTIQRPARLRDWPGVPPSVDVNVVTVQEVDAPDGGEPVCWRLVTTEPIETPKQIEAIVDAYRARWRIEEFFKALKTGCAFEKRQLESIRTLVNALAVFSIIAWRLLLLRSVARSSPESPATTVLTRDQVRLLRTLSTMKEPTLPKLTIPPRPTASDALAAVAALGGHLKANGPPGWMVLGRGYDALLLLQLGWRAARCDR